MSSTLKKLYVALGVAGAGLEDESVADGFDSDAGFDSVAGLDSEVGLDSEGVAPSELLGSELAEGLDA